MVKKLRLAALILALLALPVPSLLFAQSQIGSGHFWANSKPQQAPPSDAAPSAILDRAFSSSVGSTIYRALSGWVSAVTRIPLTANTSVFVRTDGNDSFCTGLTNAAYVSGVFPQNCGFTTWAKAVSYVTTALDFNGFTVTVQNGSTGGSYAQSIIVNAPWTGGGSLIFDLGAGIINAPSLQKAFITTAVIAAAGPTVNPGSITVQNGTLNSTSFTCLQNAGVGTVNLGANLTFGNCAEFDIQAVNAGAIIAGSGSSFTKNGTGGSAFAGARAAGHIFLIGATYNLSANVTYSSGFVAANDGGVIEAGGPMTFTLNAHTVTGPRFLAAIGGVIDSGGGGPNYFPGSSPGVLQGGGAYDLLDRQVLQTATTYFVRTDGNDPNCTGLTNAAYVSGSYPQNCAFQTWGKGVSYVTNSLDFSGQTVTISNGGNAQTFTTGISMTSAWSGGGALVFDFGGGTLNVAGIAVQFQDFSFPGTVTLQNGTLKGGTAIAHGAYGTVLFGTGLTFGACTGRHMQATTFGAQFSLPFVSYTVNGSATSHYYAADGGKFTVPGVAITFSGGGTIAFGTTGNDAFAAAKNTGIILGGSGTFTCSSGCSTVGGSTTVTGRRFISQLDGYIDPNGSGVSTPASLPNYFPGNAAGTGTNKSATPFGFYNG